MFDKILDLGRKLIPKKLFSLAQPIYHFLLAMSGNIIYRFPGRKLVCIGVTGTNGKSTTVEVINSILRTAGYKTGMISTVALEVAGVRTDNETSRTTLGRWQTPKMLRQMVKNGCTHAVIEVASEGLIQHRTLGIPFTAAVFTNLSPEHLNTHKTMGNYRNAKGRLFVAMALSKVPKGQKKISVYNADDREAGYFGSFPADIKIGFGIKKGDIIIKNVKSDKKLNFEISDKNKIYNIASDLLGAFNAQNIVAAWCVGRGLGIDPKEIIQGISRVKEIKGRMQEIPNKKGVRVFVDYAMTPDSYEMLFSEMRKFTKNKLITVFGAAGDRDRSKRPKIGKISAEMTDYVLLTDDEPYSENPKKIIDEIKSGFPKNFKNYEVINDRKQALKKAISIAQKGDVVVVPGMGHEKWRNVGGTKKIYWNEPEIIKKLLK